MSAPVSAGGQGKGLWRVAVAVPAAAASAFEAALEPFAIAVSVFEVEHSRRRDAAEPARWETDLWLAEACVVEAVLDGPPAPGELAPRLALAASSLGLPPPEPQLEPLPERDWVADTHRRFPPVAVGRYLVRGAEAPPPARARPVSLAIDAAMAFGTGAHETTAACLAFLDRLARRRPPRRVLDLGTGTGVLAIAAARTWHRPVIAVDIDRRAAGAARGNVRRNGTAALVRVGAADGCASPLVARGRPYDLILANILARPLVRLAPEIRRHLAPGGRVVLSGLLGWQEPLVIAAYRAQGLALEARIRQGEWSALAMRKKSRGARPDPS